MSRVRALGGAVAACASRVGLDGGRAPPASWKPLGEAAGVPPVGQVLRAARGLHRMLLLRFSARSLFELGAVSVRVRVGVGVRVWSGRVSREGVEVVGRGGGGEWVGGGRGGGWVEGGGAGAGAPVEDALDVVVVVLEAGPFALALQPGQAVAAEVVVVEVAGHVVVEVGVVVPFPAASATTTTSTTIVVLASRDVSAADPRDVRQFLKPALRLRLHLRHLVRLERLVDEDGRQVLLPHLLLPLLPGAAGTSDVGAAPGGGADGRAARAGRGLRARLAVSLGADPFRRLVLLRRAGAGVRVMVVDVGDLARGQVGDHRHAVVKVGGDDLRGTHPGDGVGVGACAVRHVTSAADCFRNRGGGWDVVGHQ